MPESAGHVASDNPDCQRSCKKLRRMVGPEMDQSDHPDMKRRRQASYLIRPVPGPDDIQDDLAAPSYDGQVMPG